MTVTYHHPSLIFTYYCVIPHPEGGRILLVKTGDRLSLPHFQPEEHHFGVVDHINVALAEKYGLKVAVLRCLGDEYVEDGVHRYYAIDYLAHSTEVSEGLQWAYLHELPDLPVPKAQRAVVARWHEWQHQTDERRSPWSQAGWYTEASAVLTDFADRMDMVPTNRVEQVRAWARSSVLRTPTEKGHLFLKAVPNMFAYEIKLTRIFSLRYPPHIPQVLAINGERSWMLMDGFKGSLLSQVKDIAIWERTLKRYARLQIDLDKSGRALMNMGVPDRNIDALASQVEALAADLPAELSEDEQDLFRRSVRLLRSLCYELMDYQVPLTLLHGDFWPGNIVVREDTQEPVFFDWSDSAVSHPFFDLPFFLDDIEDMLPGVPDARRRLRDAYLTQWARYESPGRLRNLYRIARVIGPLHYALTYHAYVLPGMAPSVRWEMSAMLPLMVRKVLAEFEQYQKAEQ